MCQGEVQGGGCTGQHTVFVACSLKPGPSMETGAVSVIAALVLLYTRLDPIPPYWLIALPRTFCLSHDNITHSCSLVVHLVGSAKRNPLLPLCPSAPQAVPLHLHHHR